MSVVADADDKRLGLLTPIPSTGCLGRCKADHFIFCTSVSYVGSVIRNSMSIILLLNLHLAASRRDLLTHHYAVHFGQTREAIDGGSIFYSSQTGHRRKLDSSACWSRFYVTAFTGLLCSWTPHRYYNGFSYNSQRSKDITWPYTMGFGLPRQYVLVWNYVLEKHLSQRVSWLFDLVLLHWLVRIKPAKYLNGLQLLFYWETP